MVIHDFQGDHFWILYTIAGVGLPLAGLTAARHLRRLAASRRQSGSIAET
ncbi:MAG: hypothetical protein K2L85_09775 [Paramuribaculum sp.]|nr:hypothetical protein [Paramuribaculum sp.]